MKTQVMNNRWNGIETVSVWFEDEMSVYEIIDNENNDTVTTIYDGEYLDTDGQVDYDRLYDVIADAIETYLTATVDEAAETEPAKTPNKYQKEVITMKATKYTNKELVEIYKNLKTSAKILGFSSASDSEMIAEIEIEAIKRHLNLIDGTVEETAERQTVETTEQAQADETAETVKKTERKINMKKKKINMKKNYNEMTLEELNNEHIRLIDWADEAETDRQAESRLKKVSEFETYYKARFEELRKTQATDEITVQETMEAVEGISKMETTTETDDSGFEYTTSQAQEIIMTGTSIAKAEEKKTQFDFYNVTIGFEVEKFIGTIPADYESLGIYSDYEKAVQAAQAAADEYGAENIYFHTVEIATRNDGEVYDRDDYEDFIEERETIRHNWYTLMIVDTGKREYVNLDKPVRLDFKE